jgi:hypothetical protein
MLQSFLKKLEKPTLVVLDKNVVSGIRQLAEEVTYNNLALILGDICTHIEVLADSKTDPLKNIAAHLLFDELVYPKELLSDGIRARKSIRAQLGRSEMEVLLYSSDHQIHLEAKNRSENSLRQPSEVAPKEFDNTINTIDVEIQKKILEIPLLRVRNAAFGVFSKAFSSHSPDYFKKSEELLKYLKSPEGSILSFDEKNQIFRQIDALRARKMLPSEAIEIFESNLPSIIDDFEKQVTKYNKRSNQYWDPSDILEEAIGEARTKLQRAVITWEPPVHFVSVVEYLNRI